MRTHRPTPTPAPLAGQAARPAVPGGVSQRFSDLLRQRRVVGLPPELDAQDESAEEIAAIPPQPPPGHTSGRAPEDDDAEPAIAGPETAPPEPVLTPQPLLAPQPPADAPWTALVRDVAQTVATFCNDRAVAQTGDWHVQMPLRADVVAGTMLHLSLSSHWLVLRFCSQDAKALALLSDGRRDLIDFLETSLSRKREISIGFDPS